MGNTSFKNNHPVVLGAAVSAIVVSLVGAAAIVGILPVARSAKTEISAPNSAAATDRYAADAAPTAGCASCGTLASVRSVEIMGTGSGLGAIAGGLTGAALGSQLGKGNGNTAMTLLGAAGGALAGNEIERNAKKRVTFRVTVRMDDGSFRTFSQSAPPAVSVGERVRIVNGAVVARS